MKTLRDVKIGKRAKVIKLHGEGALKRRIMDMGITKGVEIFVRKVAPLGDPLEISVRGYELSSRNGVAEMREVEYIYIQRGEFSPRLFELPVSGC